MNSNILLLMSFLLFISCKNKDNEGTPDDYAIDDNLITLTNLDETLEECSGLIMIDGVLWAHNDNGNPKIYSIPENEASIDQKVNIINTLNIDWEDLALDNTYLYIGDFGNNSGERQDLAIYKVPKINLPDDTEAETLFFLFEDQNNFNNTTSMHNFDCEAMITFEDNIYLFSKNHLNHQTKRYKRSKDPGVQIAEKIDEFNVDGLITGADIDLATNTLCLLGYNIEGDIYAPFIWIFYDFSGNDFFGGKSKRVNFPIQAQMEGIAFKGNGKFLLASENENGEVASLYLFDAEKWKE
ncbi:MAG: hypothetical protein ACI8P3_002497 [Saprospiraceae bacterium]|jgi:hypothetical protein